MDRTQDALRGRHGEMNVQGSNSSFSEQALCAGGLERASECGMPVLRVGVDR